MLMGGPHLRGVQQGPCALLLELYTRTGENAPLARTLFRAHAALFFTVPKANNRGLRCVENESRRDALSSLERCAERTAAPRQSRAWASAARRSASSRRTGFADSASPFLAPAADRGTRRRVRRRGSDSAPQSRLPRNRRKYTFARSRRSRTSTCRGAPACPRSSACIQGRTPPGLRWGSRLPPAPRRCR